MARNSFKVHPLVIIPRRITPDFTPYSDSSYQKEPPNATMAAAALFRANADPTALSADLVVAREATLGDLEFFADTSDIFGLALFTASASFFAIRHIWTGRVVTIYLGNNASPLP